MIKVNIYNSFSQVENISREHYSSLKRDLSYRVPGSYFSQDPNNGIRYLLSKKGEFPTGLLKRVIAWSKDNKLPLQLIDHRKRLIKQNKALIAHLGSLVPYNEQLLAAKLCHKHHRGIVQAPTGSGKSVMIALTINEIKQNTLVVVPSLELKRQLTEGLIQFYGKSLVGGLGKPIAVENVQALDPAKPLKGYTCVILDEFHHSAALTYRKLNKYAWKDVYYRLGFTATPYRSQDEEQALLESILSDVIYKISHETAVEKGFIVPVEAYYYELPKQEVKGSTWPSVYKELVVGNSHRNALIKSVLQALRYASISALCLVKEVAHGQELAGEHVPFAHGENEHTAALIKTFNKGSSCLVGTTGVLGEGVDTKPCEYVILAGLGKSRPALMQAFGRCFRKYPGKETGKIIIFKDTSHKWTKEHFKEQCRVLKEEYGITPIKLPID